MAFITNFKSLGVYVLLAYRESYRLSSLCDFRLVVPKPIFEHFLMFRSVYVTLPRAMLVASVPRCYHCCGCFGTEIWQLACRSPKARPIFYML